MSDKWRVTALLLFIFSAALLSAQSETGKVYRAAEGKGIGIWPHNDRFKSVEKLEELRNRWGFNYLLMAAIYDTKEKKLLKDAGFDSLHIAYQIYIPDLIGMKESFYGKLEEIGKIWAYYFDEPISREHSYGEFLNLIVFLSNSGLYPHAKFIASELDERKAVTISLLMDDITYSGYGSREKLGSDQIKSWSEWRNYIGAKFGMPWISADQDSNEYRTLLKSAQEMKFNFVWFYALEPLPENMEVSDRNYEKFCEAAVEFGFMVREKIPVK
jgi:hypothetical protein